MSQREKRGFRRNPPVFPVEEFEDSVIAPWTLGTRPCFDRPDCRQSRAHVVSHGASVACALSGFPRVCAQRLALNSSVADSLTKSIAAGVAYPAMYISTVSTRSEHPCPAARFFARCSSEFGPLRSDARDVGYPKIPCTLCGVTRALNFTIPAILAHVGGVRRLHCRPPRKVRNLHQPFARMTLRPILRQMFRRVHASRVGG
jgi:hypothetical protein